MKAELRLTFYNFIVIIIAILSALSTGLSCTALISVQCQSCPGTFRVL